MPKAEDYLYPDQVIITRAQHEALTAAQTDLCRIANFIEPHWIGAGAKLEAGWIIAAISKLNTERDDLERKNEALMAKVG